MKNTTSNAEQNSLKMLPTNPSPIQNPPKNFSNLLLFEEKNQTKELFQAVMAFKNPKNLKQISEDPGKEQIITEVIRICNKLITEMMEEGIAKGSSSFSGSMQEIFDLVETLLNLVEVHESKIIGVEITYLNNYASFHLINKDIHKAKECLKSAEKLLVRSNKLSLWGLTYNNLANIAFMTQDYLLCYRCSEKTLYKLETPLFKRIKEISRPERARQIPDFMSELLFVLIGYMNMAISLEYIQKNPTLIPKSEKLTAKDPKLFYQNGHKLSQKYLSEDHSLTKKFNFLLNHGIEDGINLKPLSNNLNLMEELEENQGRSSVLNFNNNLDSFDKTSEMEEGLPNARSKAFRVSTKKKNDYRTKSLNKVRSIENEEEEESSFQANFTNGKLNKSHNISKEFPFKKQMKEFEKTVKDLKKIKEKYERNESQLFLHKNLELLFQQRELEEFIAKRRDFNSSLIYPNASSMFYVPPSQSTGPFMAMNKGQVPMDNSYEILMQKQKEMETMMMNLQRENAKILQENQEKNNEMQKLQNYVLKLEAERTSKELERKMQTQDKDTSKEMKHGKPSTNELGIAPIGSYKFLNESNLSETSTKAKENLRKEEKKAEAMPENKPLMKKSTPTNKVPGKEATIESIPKKITGGSNIIAPNAPIKKSSSKNFNEGTPSHEKQRNPAPDKQAIPQEKPKERPKLEKHQSSDKNNEKVPQSQDKPPLDPQQQYVDTSFAPNNVNLRELSSKRSDSIKKILVEYKGLNKQYHTTESIRKQDSLSSIDLALDPINPSHLLKNILGFVAKSAVIRKKVFIDSKVFVFEFRIILQENENHIFKLMAFYDATGKPAIKEETMQITLIRKILQNIDYRDVIPFIYPLKTIAGVMKFSRYFILPFLGIGESRNPAIEENSNDRKVEIWPKAHGLIDKNIKILFMGDEYFMFFHFLINDSFRLVLSNIKNGLSLRMEYQFDASSLRKFFELLENGKNTQPDEIQDIVRVVEIMEDEDIKDEMIREAQGIIAKYLHNKAENEIFVENFRVLDLTVFISFLEKTIKEFEEFLKSRGYASLDPLATDDKIRIFKVKVWNEGNRYRFGILLENIEKKEFEITLKNGFDSHAPMKKLVKALGTTSFGFDGIWKNFGLAYNKLDISDKYMVSSIILDSYSLEIHEKVLDKDDYDRYESNPIIPLPLECGGFYRTFIGNQFKYPLTLSLIGYQGVPVGVKVVIYDPNECKENGMFFTVNSDMWKKKGLAEQNKKKGHRYLSVIPIEGDFHLHFILEKVGFRAILNAIQFERNVNNGVDTLGRCLIKGSFSYVDNLENLLTMPTILEVYKNEV